MQYSFLKSDTVERLLELEKIGVSFETICKGITIMRALDPQTNGSEWSFFSNLEEIPMPLEMEREDGTFISISFCIR